MITVNFQFADLTNSYLSSPESGSAVVIPRVAITPTNSKPVAYNGKIIVLDTVTTELDVSGSASFADVVPAIYEVDVIDSDKVTPFYIQVPTGSGTYNAADLFYTGSV